MILDLNTKIEVVGRNFVSKGEALLNIGANSFKKFKKGLMSVVWLDETLMYDGY